MCTLPLKLAVAEHYFVRGNSYSALGFFTEDGFIASHCREGSYDEETFCDAVELYLVRPCLITPFHVITLDNCNIHYSHRFLDLIYSTGATVMFLPPYSPSLNPIEKAFDFSKRWIRRHHDRAHMWDSDEDFVRASLHQVTKGQARVCFHECQYLGQEVYVAA
jgi:hypothetical protein